MENYETIAEELFQNEEDEELFELTQNELSENPQNSRAYYYQYQYFYCKGEYKRALESIEMAIKLEPLYFTAHEVKAECLHTMTDFKDISCAIKYLESVLEQYSKETGAYDCVALFYTQAPDEISEYYNKDFEDLIKELYTKMLNYIPNQSHYAHKRIVDILYMQNYDYSGALHYYANIITHIPFDDINIYKTEVEYYNKEIEKIKENL